MRNNGVLKSHLKDRAKGSKRCLKLLVVGGHDVILFGRGNIGKGRGRIGDRNQRISTFRNRDVFACLRKDRTKGSKRCLNSL
jgi:hypothetical protein